MTHEDLISLLGDRARIEGGKLIVLGGYVYLPSLTTMPEGVEFRNSGFVDLHSLPALPEGVEFRNGGYVDLPSLTNEVQRYHGKQIRLRNVDAFTMLIKRERACAGFKIARARYFGGGPIEQLRPCFIASNDDFSAHGSTIAKAISDLRFKIAQVDFDKDDLIAEISSRGTVRFDDFRLLTGACSEGLREGMAQAGIDPDATELPLSDVLAKAHGPYGNALKECFEAADR